MAFTLTGCVGWTGRLNGTSADRVDCCEPVSSYCTAENNDYCNLLPTISTVGDFAF